MRAPAVHWQYCSGRVLTLEYLPGGCFVFLGGAGCAHGRRARRAPRAHQPHPTPPHPTPPYPTPPHPPGIKLSDKARLEAAGVAAGLVARRATEAYLIQILRHGFFHADPHPGCALCVCVRVCVCVCV